MDCRDCYRDYLILIGVKKYHMRDILKSWTKKEKLGTLVGIAILLLGIMMKISKTPLTVGNGIVSKGFSISIPDEARYLATFG